MQLNSTNKSAFSCHLDFIRGVAAFAVLAYHIRYRFFLDYSDLPETNVVTKAFYAATSFGHDAVIVFFVLSGFLISTSIVRDCKAHKWSWTRYWVNRLTRLYVVLVPGLLLTLCWDRLGLAWFPDATIYTGDQSVAWQHDFFSVNGRLAITTLLGNVLFLQPTWVAPFGSNDPLWSLAFEFWYYVLFAAIYAGVIAGAGTLKKVLWAGVAITACFIAGSSVLLYFSVWLLGAGLAALPAISRPVNTFHIRLASAASFVLFVALMCAGHVQAYRDAVGNSLFLADLGTGIGAVVFLYVLRLDSTSPSLWYQRTSAAMASMSFTLYVVHMPLLVFLRAWLIPGDPWMGDWLQIGYALILFLAAVLYAALVWLVTEAHTDRVRRLISRWFLRGESVPRDSQPILTVT